MSAGPRQTPALYDVTMSGARDHQRRKRRSTRFTDLATAPIEKFHQQQYLDDVEDQLANRGSTVPLFWQVAIDEARYCMTCVKLQ